MNFKNFIRENSFLAISIGIVYFWFGILKFFPELSPAENLAIKTIDILTFKMIPANISIILLAFWELIIGLFLILNIFRKEIIILALIHMFLTFTPMIFFSKEVFSENPIQLTLLGQYIVKNIIIIGALLSLYSENQLKIMLN